MSSSASPGARLEAIEIVIEELLYAQLATLPADRAAALTGRLQARAGYVSADPGYDTAERHAHDVAAAMDLLLRAVSRRASETAAIRNPARNLPLVRGEIPLRRANGGIEPVGILD